MLCLCRALQPSTHTGKLASCSGRRRDLCPAAHGQGRGRPPAYCPARGREQPEHLDHSTGLGDLLSRRSSKMKPETRSDHSSSIKIPQVPREAGAGPRVAVSFLPRRRIAQAAKRNALAAPTELKGGTYLPGHRLSKTISEVATKTGKVQETDTYPLLARSPPPGYASETTPRQIVAGSPARNRERSSEDHRRVQRSVSKKHSAGIYFEFCKTRDRLGLSLLALGPPFSF